jgi:hypothetical protein
LTDDMLEGEKMSVAATLVSDIVLATRRLADATTEESTLEDNRHNVKFAITERIMTSGDNRLTGKPHSFSSAEAATTADPEYMNYLERLRSATRERILARGAYEAAIAAARLREAVHRVE